MRSQQCIKYLLCLGLIFVRSEVVASQEPAAPSPQASQPGGAPRATGSPDKFSPFYYEKQLDRSTDRIELLGSQESRLKTILEQLQSEILSVESLAKAVGDSAGPTSRLHTVLARPRTGTGPQPRADGGGVPEVPAETLVRDNYDTLYEEVHGLHNNLIEISANLAGIDSRFISLMMENSAKSIDEFETASISSAFDIHELQTAKYNVLDNIARFEDANRFGSNRSTSAAMERAAIRVESALSSYAGALVVSVNRIQSRAIRLKGEITVASEENKRQMSAAKEAQTSAQAQLTKAYNEYTSSGSINQYLSGSVILMIVAMVALYFSLRLFQPAFARTIIQYRLLIELLSMGFILLTVIILGTARLLNSAALAALLGTMAGYIFGRKPRIFRLNRREGAQTSTGPRPD